MTDIRSQARDVIERWIGETVEGFILLQSLQPFGFFPLQKCGIKRHWRPVYFL